MSNIQLSDGVIAKLKEIHDDIVGDSIGVSQAISEMTKSMTKVKTCMSSHEYEKATALGYTDLSSSFIFLQRCLGGLHNTMRNKDIIIQNLAFEYKMAFEDVAPIVETQMSLIKP